MRGPIVAVLFAMAPVLAWGAQLGISTSSALEYDSNVGQTVDGKTDDLIFRTVQRLSFFERGNGYGYSLRYSVPYRVSIRTNVANDFDHYGGGAFDVQLGPRTTLAGDGSFSFINSSSTVSAETGLEDEGTVLAIAKQDELYTRATGSLGLDHTFTGRLNGRLDVSYDYFHSTVSDQHEVNTISGLTGLNYRVNSRSLVGFGANFSYQDFSDVPGRPGSTTLTTRVFASWVYRFDDSFSFSIRGGPTLISTDQRSAQPVVEAPSSFLFEELATDRNFPAGTFAIDTDDNGTSDALFGLPVTAPAGSVVIAPEDACPQLELGTRVVAGSPLCSFQSLLVKGVDDAAIDAVLGNLASGPYPLPFEDPPGPPPSFNDQTLTFFGSFDLRKRWSPRLNSVIGYRRTQSDASGLGGSTILDTVNASVSWRISPLWRASLNANWTHRQSAAPTTRTFATVTGSADPALAAVPGLPTVAELTGERVFRIVTNQVATTRWTVAGRMERTITPQLRASVDLRYNQQSSRSGSAGSATDFDNFIATLRFTYNFNAIDLW